MYESGDELIVQSHNGKQFIICPHCGEEEEFNHIPKTNEVVHVCADKEHALMAADVVKEAAENTDPNISYMVKCDKCNFKETALNTSLIKTTHCPCCKKKLEMYTTIQPPEGYP